MSGDDFGNLAYLVLLGCVVGGYFFTQSRRNLGKTAQQAAIWALIFVGAVAVAGLWPGLRDTVAPRQNIAQNGDIILPMAADGHFHMRLDLDGVPVEFLVDTGATDMVLSQQDATRIGVDVDGLAWLGEARTANGTVPLARIFIDEVRLGDMVDRAVAASVNGGEMDTSLLGMSYLQRFGRISIEGRTLTLSR